MARTIYPFYDPRLWVFCYPKRCTCASRVIQDVINMVQVKLFETLTGLTIIFLHSTKHSNVSLITCYLEIVDRSAFIAMPPAVWTRELQSIFNFNLQFGTFVLCVEGAGVYKKKVERWEKINRPLTSCKPAVEVLSPRG
jgi:hypothetical protein